MLEHWISVGAGLAPATARVLFQEAPQQALKQRMLSYLIATTRTIAEARESGIEVSDATARTVLQEMEFAQLHRLPPIQPELQSLIADKAESQEDRVRIIKVHMLFERLQQRELAQAERMLTQAQLVSYYRVHISAFVLPERRDVAVIESFGKANADAAKREIDSGRNLLRVLSRRNEEDAVGGLKRGMSRIGLPHEYEENYFTAPPHVLVGPLKSEIYYLFEVTAVYPARQQTFAEAQQKIRKMLIANTRQEVLARAEHMLDEQWRGRTQCRAAYTVRQCGGRLT